MIDFIIQKHVYVRQKHDDFLQKTHPGSFEERT